MTTKKPTFEEAWAKKEAEGYQYGEDALEQVRFGWEIREEYGAAVPSAEEIAEAILDAIDAWLDDSRNHKQAAINTLTQAIRDIAMLSNGTDGGTDEA